MEGLFEIGKLAVAFLVGLSSHIGACARPAGELITEKQHTTVAVPLEVGVNPPSCS